MQGLGAPRHERLGLGSEGVPHQGEDSAKKHHEDPEQFKRVQAGAQDALQTAQLHMNEISLLDGVIEGGQPGRTTVQSQVIAMNEPGRRRDVDGSSCRSEFQVNPEQLRRAQTQSSRSYAACSAAHRGSRMLGERQLAS